jgi:hypothetical protein
VALRAVRTPPYGAGLGILAWVRAPGIWHELEGECLRRGVELRYLSYDRFLNVAYQAMISRLEYDSKNPERPRRELDRQLSVARWRVPGVRVQSRRPEIDPSAPYWWDGDEDASQSFFQAMGVVT